MANGVTIEIEGLAALQKKLGRIPNELVTEVDVLMDVTARGFENRAVAVVAVGETGFLKGGISYEKLAPMQYEIVSAMHYSAYVEFGTITQVRVPAGLEAYAMQFKGRGIKKTGGMRARPFFFPQLPIAQQQIDKGLPKVVAKILNK